MVPGVGDTPISFTGRPDVARYIGFVFTNLPAEKLEWKVFCLEGERTVRTVSVFVLQLTTKCFRPIQTFNEILRSYQERTGKALEISHVSHSELEKRSDIVATLALSWDKGEGVVGDILDNNLYPVWNPKKVSEYIQLA